ncbi:unnamed protein product [Gadus morhua 'NCC']
MGLDGSSEEPIGSWSSSAAPVDLRPVLLQAPIEQVCLSRLQHASPHASTVTPHYSTHSRSWVMGRCGPALPLLSGGAPNSNLGDEAALLCLQGPLWVLQPSGSSSLLGPPPCPQPAGSSTPLGPPPLWVLHPSGSSTLLAPLWVLPLSGSSSLMGGAPSSPQRHGNNPTL